MSATDQELNEAEGWNVFEAIGTQDEGTLRIERIDEREVFASDMEAWVFVMVQAAAGSERHMRALTRVFEDNPTECKTIIGYALTLRLQVPDQLMEFYHA